MGRFTEGCGRSQRLLLPGCIDDYVAEDNPVRVVDIVVDELDLSALGFAGAAATGRPGHPPAMLLKLYVYGYLNQVQSSRRLEREAGRNIELMWLTGKPAPDFKTIADFRRDHGAAIQAACRRFVLLCRGIARPADLAHRPGCPRDGIGRHRNGVVGYDLQAAVDTGSHIVVAHEVILSHDRTSLANMGRQAREATGTETLTVLADRGCYSGPEVLACKAADVVPVCPKPLTSGAKADGRFGKQDVVYQPDSDTYRCPAGDTLIWRYRNVGHGMTLNRYRTSNCGRCAMKPQRTPAEQRRVTRCEHEAVMEAMQTRLDRMPGAMRIRRRTVEHVFGTLKDRMGRSHFKTRTLKNVATETSLPILAYNIKPATALVDVPKLMAAMHA